MFLHNSTILRYVPLLSSRFVRGEDNLILLQAVRWRKRRWAPKSLTKIYYVRERTPTDPEELKELKQRYDNYRTSQKALRKYLFAEVQQQKAAFEASHSFEKHADEMRAALTANEEWNLKTAQLREARVAEETRVREERNLAKLIKLEEEEKQRIEKAKLYISKQQELAQTFITADSLDEVVDQALSSPTTYNFVIDREGKVHREAADGSLTTESIDEQLEKLTLEDKVDERTDVVNS